MEKAKERLLKLRGSLRSDFLMIMVTLNALSSIRLSIQYRRMTKVFEQVLTVLDLENQSIQNLFELSQMILEHLQLLYL